MRAFVNKSLGISALFAVAWSVLAFVNPTTTYHVAPVIVAAWPPLTEREPGAALRMAAAGFVLALVVTAVLGLSGQLEGPSLLPWGGAGTEAVVAAVIGAGLGVVPSLFAKEDAPT